MSIINVRGHEVTRSLSEPSDQTMMHVDVITDSFESTQSVIDERWWKIDKGRQQIHRSVRPTRVHAEHRRNQYLYENNDNV